MIQATVPSDIGIMFTSGKLSGALVLSGLVTMVAISYVLSLILRRRCTARRLTLGRGVLRCVRGRVDRLRW
jgi:hypothetical protein